MPSISRDDRVLLRLARLEELGDARQTAGDVLGLGGLARDLGDDVAGLDGVAVVDVDVGADRQEVTRLLRSSPGSSWSCRASSLIEMRGRASASFDSMMTLRERPVTSSSCSCIVTPVDDVAVLHDAADLGEDRHRERIPLGQQRLGGDLLAVLDQQLGAVDQRVALALAARVVGDDELAVAVHDHEVALLRRRSGTFSKLDRALVAGLERRLLGADLADAADVEGTHRQLGARLADRLGGDDADRFADVDHAAARQVTAVALRRRCRAGSGR